MSAEESDDVGFTPISQEKFDEAAGRAIRGRAQQMIEHALCIQDHGLSMDALPLTTGIRIGCEAYKHAIEYAREASAGYHPRPEIYFHMMMPKTGRPISDVLIAPDQIARATTCKLDDDKMRSDLGEISNLGMEYAGWMHSHAEMNVFHSERDRENLESLIRTLALEHETTLSCGGVQHALSLRFVPSVVINVHGHNPNGAIKYRYRSPLDGAFVHYFQEPVPVIIEDVPSRLFFSDLEIAQQIEDRVTVEGCEWIGYQ